jgi:insulysin
MTTSLGRFLLLMSISLIFSDCTKQTQVIAPLQQELKNSDKLINIDPTGNQVNQVNQRVVQLENGLEALLICDPKANKSSAALDVRVGSLAEPDAYPGMAHFIEHLLFMGTAKYPDVDDYESYLADNQGSSNAFTDDESTNYHFEVIHDAFEGALDRLAQFFKEPLFNPDYVSRELQAVNAEYLQNLQSDYWKIDQVKKTLLRTDHPLKRFSIGNVSTLSAASQAELLAFHEKYYSANQMKLSLYSTASLEQQEKWIRAMFADVENNKRADLEYSGDLFESGSLPQVIRIKPTKESYDLQLEFFCPPVSKHVDSKPLKLLSSLIGYEGPGSLLSTLKKKELATELYSGTESSSFLSVFQIEISLTELGNENPNAVVEEVFSWINLLRSAGVKDYFFNQEQSLGEMRYRFHDRMEGMGVVAFISERMQMYPAESFYENLYLLESRDDTVFEEYLNLLNPRNMRMTHIAPDVRVDRIEKYFETEYSTEKLNAETLARFENAQAGKDMYYPEPNPYIPDDLDLLPVSAACTPHKIIDDERGVFWFVQDSVFNLPKARITLNLLSTKPGENARNRLLNKFYARMIDESISEWIYPAKDAGLSFSIRDTNKGIGLIFNGYSQRIPNLIRDIAGRLRLSPKCETIFQILKTEINQELQNGDMNGAYRQVFDEFDFLMTPGLFHRRQLLSEIESITYDDVKKYAESVFDSCSIKGAGIGNLESQELENSINDLYHKISSSAISIDDLPETRRVDLPDKSLARVFSSGDNNYCWFSFVEFGPRDPRTEAILRVGAAVLDQEFYNELRTNQQLGYAVFSYADYFEDGVGYAFLIQSPQYEPSYLAGQTWTWVDKAIRELGLISPEEFELIQQAVKAELEHREANMPEALDVFYYHAFELDGEFDYRKLVKEELSKLTIDDVAAAFKIACEKESRTSLSIFYDAVDKAVSTPPIELIQNVNQFNQEHPNW